MAQAQERFPEMAGNAPSVPRQQARLGRPSKVLVQAMSNPWLDDGQKRVIGAVAEQKMREQTDEALQMQKAQQIELQQMAEP